MSTRGFISIKHDNKIIGTYNHSDSYPTWLGVRMVRICLLYTSPIPRDRTRSRMPSSA